MAKEITSGILQRDKETYGIVPRLPMGLLTPDVLRRMADTAEKFEIPIIKITSAQRIALVGIKPDDVDGVWESLDMPNGPAEGACVHYVQACPGTETCKFGQQNSLGLAAKLEEYFGGGTVEMPAKTKIAVSGCKLNCAECFVRDIGAFGTKDGWTVTVGGNSGGRPRIADVLAENLTDDEAYDLIKKSLEYFAANAKARTRMPRFIERIGIEEFKKAVL